MTKVNNFFIAEFLLVVSMLFIMGAKVVNFSDMCKRKCVFGDI